MKRDQNIFVAGGNGFLGKHVVEILKERGYDVVSRSLRDGTDFRNLKQTTKLLEDEKCDALINCAAYSGGIQFVAERPAEIFYTNVLLATNLLEAARLAG